VKEAKYQKKGEKDGDSDGRSSSEQISEAPRTKISAHMFLLVTGAHFLSCSIHSGLLCMLPVWFLTGQAKGGLDLSAGECGFLISAVGLILFHVNIFLRQRLLFVLRASPLRAMRIGAGAMVFACMLLPHLSHTSLWHIENQSGHRRSMLSMIAPVLLSSLIICFSRLVRQASNVIFQIALDPSFTSPSTIISAVTNLSDVLGPVIFSSIFSNCYSSNRRYPMDTSFFLTFISCSSFSLYIGTLMLNVQFKGDFGVITDLAIRRARSRNPSANIDQETLLDFLLIPIDDLSLLMVPSMSGYTARLSHLNVKEI
jgi:hypothetical protein